jgi:hypothetical protein
MPRRLPVGTNAGQCPSEFIFELLVESLCAGHTEVIGIREEQRAAIVRAANRARTEQIDGINQSNEINAADGLPYRLQGAPSPCLDGFARNCTTVDTDTD